MGISTLMGGFAIIFWIQYADMHSQSTTASQESVDKDYSAFPGWAIASIAVVGMMGLAAFTIKLIQEIRRHTDNQRKSAMRRPGPKQDTSDVPMQQIQTTYSELDSSQYYSQLNLEITNSHQTYLTLAPGQENTPYSQLTLADHERPDHYSQLTFDQTGAEQSFVRL